MGQINSDDKDSYQLAYTRSLMTPKDEESFALAYANTVESSEYNDALELAKMQECQMDKPKRTPKPPLNSKPRIPKDRLPLVRAGFIA